LQTLYKQQELGIYSFFLLLQYLIILFKMRIITFCLLIICIAFISCSQKTEQRQSVNTQIETKDSTEQVQVEKVMEPVVIEKDLLYDQYTLEDTYPYKDTTRVFQWEKIRKGLALLDSVQQVHSNWGILQNYKNLNGEAPLVRSFRRNEYKRVSDTLGVERYQSVPLYMLEDSLVAERYGRDGSLVKLMETRDSSKYYKIETVYFQGEWLVPKKYVKPIADTVVFNKAIFVDRTNQNITSLEKVGSKWLVRSMNPATTGLHKPPHQQETPLGMFVVQQQKSKMFFLVDGTQETGGFAPWASRFTNGGYIHGVPVNAPRKNLIEYSQTLGTTPRSHMCVRNATSHAKFIYDWLTVEGTIVFVIE